MVLAFAAEEGSGVEQFLPGDATNFCRRCSVLQQIDVSGQGPPALDIDDENLPWSPLCLLPSLLLPLKRHRLSILHHDPPGWALWDVLFECVLSWWFSGRS